MDKYCYSTNVDSVSSESDEAAANANFLSLKWRVLRLSSAEQRQTPLVALEDKTKYRDQKWRFFRGPLLLPSTLSHSSPPLSLSLSVNHATSRNVGPTQALPWPYSKASTFALLFPFISSLYDDIDETTTISTKSLIPHN